MEYNNQPLVFVSTEAQRGTLEQGGLNKNKTVVFVDESKKIYTHDVVFDGNNTTYAAANADNLGLIKIGYSASGKNYAVQLDNNNKAYVNVPWENTDSTSALTQLESRIHNIETVNADSRLDALEAVINLLNPHTDTDQNNQADFIDNIYNAISELQGASNTVVNVVNNNMDDIDFWYTYEETQAK